MIWAQLAISLTRSPPPLPDPHGALQLVRRLEHLLPQVAWQVKMLGKVPPHDLLRRIARLPAEEGAEGTGSACLAQT
jgi:hypothetical protein